MGLKRTDARKPWAFEDENNSLKRMLADAMLDNAPWRDRATKNF